MNGFVRVRKCCPVCGSVNVSKYQRNKHNGLYRCHHCMETGFVPVIKDVFHSKNGWVMSKPRSGVLECLA